MTPKINQIVPSLSYGDAIGNEVLEIKTILNSWGYDSDIYVAHVHSKLNCMAKNYKKYKKISSPNNILIFHFAIGSEVSKFVRSLPDKKIIIYHNITPSIFFEEFDDNNAHLAKCGREELAMLPETTELALGVSEYNRKELVRFGFKKTGVLPIILDFEKYDQEPDTGILNRFSDKSTNFIFVGRITPNKKQTDIIKIFYYYKNYIDSNSRLFLVGPCQETDNYYYYVKKLIESLDLEGVYITGSVNFRELLAYYKLSHIFISMSEHEGFCVPLLECMHFNIPIIAYNSSAIPYTLNGAGILVNKKNYDEIAEMANIVINNKSLREKIIKKQRLRLKYFEKSRIESVFKRYISELLH